MILTKQNKAIIDAKTYEQLLYGVRFASIGDVWFQDETGDYWLKRMGEMRAEDNDMHIRASKNIGW